MVGIATATTSSQCALPEGNHTIVTSRCLCLDPLEGGIRTMTPMITITREWAMITPPNLPILIMAMVRDASPQILRVFLRVETTAHRRSRLQAPRLSTRCETRAVIHPTRGHSLRRGECIRTRVRVAIMAMVATTRKVSATVTVKVKVRHHRGECTLSILQANISTNTSITTVDRMGHTIRSQAECYQTNMDISHRPLFLCVARVITTQVAVPPMVCHRIVSRLARNTLTLQNIICIPNSLHLL
mmetsp:Transcript_8771/g.14937  ORF Transcript_8771/g.14937 Transcript_8771/m.14937 type:complete len:244 (+) Transcript_8771:953-1684(+)